MIDLGPAAAEVARLAEHVRDDQLGDLTPCEGYPVGALLDHLMALTRAFTWAANKEPMPPGVDESLPGQARADHLRSDWREQLPLRLIAMAEAWRRPQAWEGEATVGGVTSPAGVTGLFGLDELVLHGWDLARGTGQVFSADSASTHALLPLLQGLAAPGTERTGLFGAVVDTGADACDLELVLGLAGRDPHWSAPPRV